MKKLIIISVAVIVTLIIVFSFGTVTGAGATSGWVNDLVTNANNKVNQAVGSQTDNMITNLQTEVINRVGNQLDEVVDYQSQRANTELQKYYDEKVNGIVQSPEVNAISNQVVVNTSNFIKSEKSKIDEAVANFLK